MRPEELIIAVGGGSGGSGGCDGSVMERSDQSLSEVDQSVHAYLEQYIQYMQWTVFHIIQCNSETRGSSTFTYSTVWKFAIFIYSKVYV